MYNKTIEQNFYIIFTCRFNIGIMTYFSPRNLMSGSEFEIDMDFKKKPGGVFVNGDDDLFPDLEDEDDRWDFLLFYFKVKFCMITTPRVIHSEYTPEFVMPIQLDGIIQKRRMLIENYTVM